VDVVIEPGTPRVRGVDAAYDALKLWIIRGDFALGEPLDTDVLQRRLGIGRTPLREIMQRLIEVGLVRTVPNRGTFLNQVSFRDFVQAIDARLAFEPMCARMVALKPNPARLQELVRLVEDPESFVRPDDGRELVHQLDEAFHPLLYAASGNKHVQTTLMRLFNFTSFAAHMLCNSAPPIEQTELELRAIVSGLRRRDPDAAAEALTAHIATYREMVVQDHIGSWNDGET
jgi:DNA-binding GntR family transcriptional regulator